MSAKREIIPIIGHQSERLSRHKLPTNRKALSLFFFKYKNLHLSVHQSAKNATDEIIDIWKATEIAVIQRYHIINKLTKLYQGWKNLRKSSKRKSATQKSKEKNFSSKLDKLFDITLNKSITTLTESQKNILNSQRNEGHRGRILNLNETTNENELSRNLSDCSLTPQQTQCSSTADSNSTVQQSQSFSSSSSHSLKRTPSDFEDELPPGLQPKKTKMNIMTPQLASALDRTNTSSRNATYILAAAAHSFGVQIDDVNLSSSTIHKNRIKIRKTMAEGIKMNIKSNQWSVLHWDGKLLLDLTGKKKVERLAIVLSDSDNEQLLGVPKINRGTGVNQANAIIETLNNWHLVNCITALCFDTTSVNTGQKNGTCSLLEKKLDRSFLYLACRHHIYELVLRSVVEVYWPTTTGPNVPLFKRFQESWSSIDQTQYQTGLDDTIIAEQVKDKKDEILTFISDQIQEQQPRDDYKEFLELASIFLGSIPTRFSTQEIRFRVPGANHHARWLSKAIYCLKIFIFKKQFNLTARQTIELREMCIFIVLVYVEAWFKAPLAIYAPYQDFNFLKNLIQYKSINTKISETTSSKFSGHLWYLSEELASLSFFDETVPVDMKLKMVRAIKERESVVENLKKVEIKKTGFSSFCLKDMSDFISKKSLNLFERFELSYDFLDLNPEQWKNSESFKSCIEVFQKLKVVNDIAERGVALIDKYNNTLTKNEDQKQYLLQMVQSHRKQYPTCDKIHFSASTSK